MVKRKQVQKGMQEKKKADQEAQPKQAKSLRSTKKASMQSWTGQDPTKTRRKYETNLHRKYWQ